MFVSASTLEDEDGNQDQSVPDLSAGSRNLLYTLYAAKHATDQSAIYTRLRRASIYAGMSAYGFINMQPSAKRIGTIYRADSSLTLPAFSRRFCVSTHRSAYLSLTHSPPLFFLHSFVGILLGWLIAIRTRPSCALSDIDEPSCPAEITVRGSFVVG